MTLRFEDEPKFEAEVIIGDDGSLFVPPAVFADSGLHAGDRVFVTITPVRLIVSEATADISRIMVEEGITLDDLLSGLDETRDEIYQETYGNPTSH